MARQQPPDLAAPRCPLASRGLNSALLLGCPGFRPQAVGFDGIGHGAAITGWSCDHLASHRGGRGFEPTCTHPEARTVTRAARLVDTMPGLAWADLSRLRVSVIVTDADGVVTHWNPRAEELFGWSPVEAVGRSIMETTVGDDALAVAGEVMTQVLGGNAWEGEFAARHRDGRGVPIRVLDVPMSGGDGRLAGVAGFSVPAEDARTDLRATAGSVGLLGGRPLPTRA